MKTYVEIFTQKVYQNMSSALLLVSISLIIEKLNEDILSVLTTILQGGSNMTGTDCV